MIKKKVPLGFMKVLMEVKQSIDENYKVPIDIKLNKTKWQEAPE
jgi:hypothetical protein